MGALGDILILGMGVSGRAAATYCLDRLGGDVSSVTIVDGADDESARVRASAFRERGAQVHLGSAAVEGAFDLCIASPGIPIHAPLIASAREHAQRVISEIEFAFERSTCAWVAVTGTNGKTTTTALVAHLLQVGGVPSRAVGNIGDAAIGAIEDPSVEVLVAEVSSFQLALTDRFKPAVGVLLNITPDHTDWHGSFEAYAADKARVFANMDDRDVAVIDADDEVARSLVEGVSETGASVVRVSARSLPEGGAGVHDGHLTLATHGGPIRLVDASELQIRGAHNVSNALAAAAAAHALGVDPVRLREGLRSFEPIAHRLQPVGTACGAQWFNDSKATNPDAVFKAIAAFDGSPFILLVGGKNKGNDFTDLARVASEAAREVIAFGQAGPEIAGAFESIGAPVTLVATMADAVDRAAEIACDGDSVVLSPACASFDEFDNYEQRGERFAAHVARLSDGGAR